MREPGDDIREVEKLLNKLRGPECVFYGLDVGRVKDHSALSILVRYVMPMDTDYNVLITKYYCVYLHRYPLQTPYEVLETDAARWWNWADAIGMKRYFLMDMTGVGAPVLEGIKRRRVRVIGITITGGHRETNPEPGQYDVPKSALVTQLIRTAQTGRFKGYDSIADWRKLREEMDSFGYKQNLDTSTISYESLSAKVHDDLVISVALPVWYGERIVPYRTPLRGGGATVEDTGYNPLRGGGGARVEDMDYNPLKPQQS